MTAIPACMALLTILAAGAGISCLLSAKVSLVEAIPLAWLLGCVFISVAMALLGIFSSGLILQGMLTVFCLLLGGFALRSVRGKRWRVSVPKPAGILEWLLCGAILAGCAVMIRMAAKQSLGWDGLLVWEIKARYAFLNGGVIPARYFSDQMRTWSHPEYPLLFPLVETWLYLWIGDCDQSWVRVIFPVFHMSAVLVLCGGAYRLTEKRWAGLACAGLLFFVPYGLAGTGTSLAGYADFPLGVFYLAAVIYYLRYLQEKSAAHLVLFAILAGAMPWVKNDGVIPWVCVMGIAIVDLLRQANFRRAMLVPLPGLMVIIGWKIALTVLKNPGDSNFVPITFATLRTHAHRLGPIAGELIRELMKLQSWSILWPAFVAAIACLGIGGKARLAARLAVATALPLGLYSATYVFSAWPVYFNHIHLSLPRLVLQVAPVAVLAMGIAAAGGREESHVPGAEEPEI